jgi:L-rhamnose-H+ transport protein
LEGYFFAVGAGVMSAIFNIGYALALPISDVGVNLGLTRFAATNAIWLSMLGAGSIPNIMYCTFLMKQNHTASMLHMRHSWQSWARSGAMGLLWGGSIFIYGAATPRLGGLAFCRLAFKDPFSCAAVKRMAGQPEKIELLRNDLQ